MTHSHGRLIVCGALLTAAVAAYAQPSTTPVRVRAVVTYISGSSAYIGAGKEHRVQVGDTVSFDRNARDSWLGDCDGSLCAVFSGSPGRCCTRGGRG